MTHNLSIALIYALSGVRILPCREADGHGHKAKAPYVKAGLHDASADEALVRKWWAIWPNAIVGLPCRASGILCLDADRHGQGDGVAALAGLFAQHKFAANSVPRVATPRDGLHCLFKRPASLGDTNGKIATAIDVRDNAYIIAAGSIMASGLLYSLQNGSVTHLAAAVGGARLPDLPDWLEPLLAKPARTPTASPGPLDAHTAPGGDVARRLAGLVRKVVLARPGERNATLHWAACRAGELASEGVVQREAVVAMFTEAGRQAGLPTPEARATARSGVRAGQASGGHGR